MKLLIISLMSVSLASTGFADLLLDDQFDNDNLRTSNQFKGGYYTQGQGNGSVSESGTIATLSSSANKNNFYGMLSSNTVSASSITPSTPVSTTWIISNSNLKAKTSSLIFTWQKASELTLSPEFGVLVDLNNQTLNMFANTTNNILDTVQLHVDFGQTNDAFRLTAIFNQGNFEVYGEGALLKGGKSFLDPLLTRTWGDNAPVSGDEYRAGVFVQANGKDGLVVDVDRITIAAIPEPAVISFIGLFGGGLLVCRRIFCRL